jgi:anthranilate phosphoribosyltransferase
MKSGARLPAQARPLRSEDAAPVVPHRTTREAQWAVTASGRSCLMATDVDARPPRMRSADGAVGESPPASVREVLYRVSLGLPIASGAVGRAMADLSCLPDCSARDNLLTAVLTGLMARGPVEGDVVEVLRAALSLDDAETVDLPSPSGSRLLLLAGSGKKGIKSFNVSTSSAIVAAAAGASVVKMGSRATSSVMGSRDLAERLGLPHCRTRARIVAAVERSRLAFVPIEDMIPALDQVYGGRFHVLNPLSFGLAALAARLRGGVLVFGLAHPKVDLAARVLGRLGVPEALVVASGNSVGYYADEFGLGDRSLICRLTGGAVGEVRTFEAGGLEALRPGAGSPDPVHPPGSAAEAVRWVLDALAGEGNPAHVHLIALNSALLLVTAGIARDLADGYGRSEAAINSGRAWAKVEELREEALCRQTM